MHLADISGQDGPSEDNAGIGDGAGATTVDILQFFETFLPVSDIRIPVSPIAPIDVPRNTVVGFKFPPPNVGNLVTLAGPARFDTSNHGIAPGGGRKVCDFLDQFLGPDIRHRETLGDFNAAIKMFNKGHDGLALESDFSFSPGYDGTGSTSLNGA